MVSGGNEDADDVGEELVEVALAVDDVEPGPGEGNGNMGIRIEEADVLAGPAAGGVELGRELPGEDPGPINGGKPGPGPIRGGKPGDGEGNIACDERDLLVREPSRRELLEKDDDTDVGPGNPGPVTPMELAEGRGREKG